MVRNWKIPKDATALHLIECVAAISCNTLCNIIVQTEWKWVLCDNIVYIGCCALFDELCKNLCDVSSWSPSSSSSSSPLAINFTLYTISLCLLRRLLFLLWFRLRATDSIHFTHGFFSYCTYFLRVFVCAVAVNVDVDVAILHAFLFLRLSFFRNLYFYLFIYLFAFFVWVHFLYFLLCVHIFFFLLCAHWLFVAPRSIVIVALE